MHHDDHDDHQDDPQHHLGFQEDLRTLARRFPSRRRLLQIAGGIIGGASLFSIVSCTDGGDDASDVDAASGGDGTTGGTCSSIPEETAGPYPGDGSNGANALALSGIVRQDIRTSIGSASGTADGIVLSITLTIVDSANGCAPLANHAVYLWHCDRAGAYSMYSGSASAQNYLRGVQVTDGNGQVTFTSIFPACYSGRWPHIHFEVYPTLASISSASNKVATSQLALPEATCDEVYATTGYSASVSNLNQVSLTSDNVFSDGASQQLATVTGTTSSGYSATLTVAV